MPAPKNNRNELAKLVEFYDNKALAISHFPINRGTKKPIPVHTNELVGIDTTKWSHLAYGTKNCTLDKPITMDHVLATCDNLGQHNFNVACYLDSSNKTEYQSVCVIDIDIKYHPDQALTDPARVDESLEWLHDKYGIDCSKLPHVTTGGGGMHVYFTAPKELSDAFGQAGTGLLVREGVPNEDDESKERTGDCKAIELLINKIAICPSSYSRETQGHYTAGDVPLSQIIPLPKLLVNELILGNTKTKKYDKIESVQVQSDGDLQITAVSELQDYGRHDKDYLFREITTEIGVARSTHCVASIRLYLTELKPEWFRDYDSWCKLIWSIKAATFGNADVLPDLYQWCIKDEQHRDLSEKALQEKWNEGKWHAEIDIASTSDKALSTDIYTLRRSKGERMPSALNGTNASKRESVIEAVEKRLAEYIARGIVDYDRILGTHWTARVGQREGKIGFLKALQQDERSVTTSSNTLQLFLKDRILSKLPMNAYLRCDIGKIPEEWRGIHFRSGQVQAFAHEHPIPLAPRSLFCLEMNKVLCLPNQSGKNFMKLTGNYWVPELMGGDNGSLNTTVIGRKDNGKTHERSMVALWTTLPATRKRFAGAVYKPINALLEPTLDDVRLGEKDKLNIFTGFAVKPYDYRGWDTNKIISDILPFLKYIIRLCATHENVDGKNIRVTEELYHRFRYFILWLSSLIQRASQLRSAIVISGPHGVGKSFLGSAILRNILMPKTVVEPSMGNALAKFNNFYSDSLAVFINEGVVSKPEKFKMLITEPIQVEKKFVDSYEKENNLHFLIGSNDPAPVPATPKERRVFCLNPIEAAFEMEGVAYKDYIRDVFLPACGFDLDDGVDITEPSEFHGKLLTFFSMIDLDTKLNKRYLSQAVLTSDFDKMVPEYDETGIYKWFRYVAMRTNKIWAIGETAPEAREVFKVLYDIREEDTYAGGREDGWNIIKLTDLPLQLKSMGILSDTRNAKLPIITKALLQLRGIEIRYHNGMAFVVFPPIPERRLTDYKESYQRYDTGVTDYNARALFGWLDLKYPQDR